MKNYLFSILSLAVASFAADVQVLEPTGADFSPDAPKMVSTLLRSAVSQTGNTPVEAESEIQLRTNVMVMGESYVIVCEQVKGGTVIASGKQKSASLDELDVAIEQAASAALANLSAAPAAEPAAVPASAAAPASAAEPVAAPASAEAFASAEAPASAAESAPAAKQPLPVNTSVVTVEVEEKPASDDDGPKRVAHNYKTFGLGASAWHNFSHRYEGEKIPRSWEAAYMFRYGWIFEMGSVGAVTILNNMNASFGDGWEWHELFTIGGRAYLGSGSVVPYIGLGLGFGVQLDGHSEWDDAMLAVGMGGLVEAGIVCFRNSTIQLEFGISWDAIFDGFNDFDDRFGAGSAFIAINY